MTKEQRLRETHNQSLAILVSGRPLLAAKSWAIDLPYCNAAKQRNKLLSRGGKRTRGRKSNSLKSVLCVFYRGMITATQQAVISSCLQQSHSYNALWCPRSSIGYVQLHSPEESTARGRAGSILSITTSNTLKERLLLLQDLYVSQPPHIPILGIWLPSIRWAGQVNSTETAGMPHQRNTYLDTSSINMQKSKKLLYIFLWWKATAWQHRVSLKLNKTQIHIL